MSQIIVGIADLRVSKNPGDTIVTYSLGSCIGLTVYDPVVPVGGMLHFMLPRSDIDIRKAEKKPYMFGDIGIPLLFKKIYRLGGKKNRLIVKVAGGAMVLGDGHLFDIGRRNHTIVRKLLWKNNILIASEDVGGSQARTLKLVVGDGTLTVRSRGKEVPL